MTGNRNEIIQWLLEQDSETVFDIKEHKEKRSLNANAYMWVLINEIANKVRLSKEEVYLNMLKSYGQSTIVSLLSSIDYNGFRNLINNVSESRYCLFFFFFSCIPAGNSRSR